MGSLYAGGHATRHRRSRTEGADPDWRQGFRAPGCHRSRAARRTAPPAPRMPPAAPGRRHRERARRRRSARAAPAIVRVAPCAAPGGCGAQSPRPALRPPLHTRHPSDRPRTCPPRGVPPSGFRAAPGDPRTGAASRAQGPPTRSRSGPRAGGPCAAPQKAPVAHSVPRRRPPPWPQGVARMQEAEVQRRAEVGHRRRSRQTRPCPGNPSSRISYIMVLISYVSQSF